MGPSQPTPAFFLGLWLCKVSSHGSLLVPGTGLVMHDLFCSPDKLRRQIICHHLVIGSLEDWLGGQLAWRRDQRFREFRPFGSRMEVLLLRTHGAQHAEPRCRAQRQLCNTNRQALFHERPEGTNIPQTLSLGPFCNRQCSVQLVTHCWPSQNSHMSQSIHMPLESDLTGVLLTQQVIRAMSSPVAPFILISPSLASPLHYFLCLSTFFLMCMCSVHARMLACMYVVHMHVCSYVHGGLRLMLGVFLYHSLPYWGRGTDLFSPASQLSLRIPVFCWNHRPAASPPSIFIRSGNPRSGPQTCLASSSLGASPGPRFPFFSFPTL